MSSASSPPNAQGHSIILFHYPFSPYARRIIWYLTLKGIPYAQCLQPPTLPRPTIAALGVKYRRIPICAIDGEVYADTRLILCKLEALFPSSAFSGTNTPENAAITLLIERFTTDVLFPRAAQLLPPSLPLMNDPKFLKDRSEFSGRTWSAEAQAKGRPEALIHMRNSMRLFESTFLSDGRNWALGGEQPTMADLQAVWVFDWLMGMPEALDASLMGESVFPRLFALVKRWNGALKDAKKTAPRPVTLKAEDAISSVLAGPDTADLTIDPNDPLKLSKGDVIQVWPTDSGFGHKDSGELVGLNEEELVMVVKSEKGKGVLLHTPRWGFRVVKMDGSKLLHYSSIPLPKVPSKRPRPPETLDFDARVPIPFSIFPSSYKSEVAPISQSGQKTKVEADVKITKSSGGRREDTEESIYSYSEDRLHKPYHREEQHRSPRHEEAEIRIHKEGPGRRRVDIDIDVEKRDHRRTHVDFEVDRRSYQEPYQRYANTQFASTGKFYDRTFESTQPHQSGEAKVQERHYASSSPRKDIHIHEKVTIDVPQTQAATMSSSRSNLKESNSNTITIPCHFIRVGDLLMLQGRPCQVIRISTSSATGHHRYLGVDLFSKELYEETSFVTNPSPSVVVQNMLGPVFKQYKVLDLTEEGRVVAMTEDGDIKQDLQVIKQNSLFSKLSETFDKGRGGVRVLVINDGGRELAVDFKVMHGSRL